MRSISSGFLFLFLTSVQFAADRPSHPSPQEQDQHEEAFLSAWEAADRRELVLPAQKVFVPLKKGRGISLHLTLQEQKVRPGSSIWYTLELQNIGSEPLQFRKHSFFKDGNAFGDKISFLIIDRDGRKSALVPQIDPSDYISHSAPEKFSVSAAIPKEQREAAIRRWKESSEFADVRRFFIHVTLNPGERLVTRPWRFLPRSKRLNDATGRIDPDLEFKVSGPYRELAVQRFPREPGHYQLVAVFNDPPPSRPDKTMIESAKQRGISKERILQGYHDSKRLSLGRIESNPASFEVLP